MKSYHKSYKKILGGGKKSKNPFQILVIFKVDRDMRTYKKVSKFQKVLGTKKRNEQISWQGLEERTYQEMGLEQGGLAFKPEDLFN